MNKPVGLIWVAAMGLFAACSSVIPPQTFPNPIGISGKAVQVQIGASQVSAASAGLGFIKSSFPDIDTSQVPISLTASQSLFKVGFSSNARLETDAASLPCAIVLTQLNISATLSDSSQSFTLPTFALNEVVRLEQESQDPKSYKIVTPGVFVGNVLNPADSKKVQDIITGGGANQVTVRVSVQAVSAPDLPPGSTLTFTFDTSEATLKF